ncbi:winged helix DNA-binding domain-containing protein [Nocardia asteroides]|uniref:winged helix DNA-binding domain-containing protein n=1 Tax=Nocardia asteroides TaxID=1824 RepID=UPI001E51F5EC|nr:winged helix DNA-binding domain-containing protein [Nocardia asteroides]UGT56597.1 winged helix DNA-binding domain-containing protein [Nocardia asteroides]
MAGRDSPVTVSVDAVVGFRLRAHHLTTRCRAEDLLEAAGACAVQDSPPGSALLALHARVDDVTRAGVDRLVGAEKSLLRTWSLRGAPFVFPTADAPVFTTGVLPPTEAGRLRLIGGVEQALRTLDLGLDEVVDRTAEATVPVLSGRALAVTELGEEVAARIANTLTKARRAAWEAPGPYGANQPLGEAVVHFCLRILTLRGLVCLTPRSENTAPFALLGEWLGEPLPEADPGEARAALLRRYLRCYGPSTRKDFAAWVGIGSGDAQPWWEAIAEELTPVDVDGRRTWLLAEHVDDLRAADARGVRLLPPGDPYTQMRDRATIVDPKHQRAVWKSVGAPGTVLADGVLAGTWRPRKHGRALTVTVTLFAPIRSALRTRLREEARHVAQLRGAERVEVEFDDASA